MTKFITRAYNSFQINPSTKSSIIKTSKEVRLADEIEYYLKLPNKLSIYFPRVVSSEIINNNNTLELEYYAYSNLGEAMLNNYNFKLWNGTFDFLFNYIKECSNYTIPSIQSDSTDMFIKKTENEYEKLFSNFESFGNLKKHDILHLNHARLKSFDIIWPKIKSYIESNCLSNKHQIIHGDLCFSNILYGINPINDDILLKFIDPRGFFGKTRMYGDVYYDLAKISHSCNGGYEYFINDKFSINEINQNNFLLTYSNLNKSNINILYLDFIKKHGYNLTKIKILEGTIFIGMCARHYDSPTRQIAMYLTGLKLLNEIYETI